MKVEARWRRIERMAEQPPSEKVTKQNERNADIDFFSAVNTTLIGNTKETQPVLVLVWIKTIHNALPSKVEMEAHQKTPFEDISIKSLDKIFLLKYFCFCILDQICFCSNKSVCRSFEALVFHKKILIEREGDSVHLLVSLISNNFSDDPAPKDGA